MNILHISDLHFRREYEDYKEGYKGMLARMQSPLVPLNDCLTKVQEHTNIDLLIISGDLTEDGEVEDYQFLKEWLQKKIGFKDMIVTLGNHDRKGNFRVGWCGEQRSELPYNQIVHYPDFTVISFDSSDYGKADGVKDDQQMIWLKKTLQEVGEKPIVLVTHHHLLPNQADTPIWPGTEEFLSCIAPYKIRCILNGHTHHPFTGKVRGIPYYTVASMSFIGENEGKGRVRFEEAYGYNLYQFEAGKIVKQLSENFKPGSILKTVDFSKLL